MKIFDVDTSVVIAGCMYGLSVCATGYSMAGIIIYTTGRHISLIAYFIVPFFVAIISLLAGLFVEAIAKYQDTLRNKNKQYHCLAKNISFSINSSLLMSSPTLS
jgi:hypothetical protein